MRVNDVAKQLLFFTVFRRRVPEIRMLRSFRKHMKTMSLRSGAAVLQLTLFHTHYPVIYHHLPLGPDGSSVCIC